MNEPFQRVRPSINSKRCRRNVIISEDALSNTRFLGFSFKRAIDVIAVLETFMKFLLYKNILRNILILDQLMSVMNLTSTEYISHYKYYL